MANERARTSKDRLEHMIERREAELKELRRELKNAETGKLDLLRGDESLEKVEGCLDIREMIEDGQTVFGVEAADAEKYVRFKLSVAEMQKLTDDLERRYGTSCHDCQHRKQSPLDSRTIELVREFVQRSGGKKAIDDAVALMRNFLLRAETETLAHYFQFLSHVANIDGAKQLVAAAHIGFLLSAMITRHTDQLPR